jgi:pimeloyl-ACP methyl ester carboxylesterase
MDACGREPASRRERCAVGTDDLAGGAQRDTRRRIGRIVASAAVALGAGVPARTAHAAWPLPPGQPATGYGSRQGYISPGSARHEEGDQDAGTAVIWFVPQTLRDGRTAPVVVFVHGFRALAPEIYGGHLAHLVQQGLLVVFPQYNMAGLDGLFTDLDQNAMLRRAIESTNLALERIGARANRRQVHLFGHSLGGLLAAAWTAAGGAAPASLTLANPSLGGVPLVQPKPRSQIQIVPIDYVTMVPATTAPSVLLTGDADWIARPEEALRLWDLLPRAASRVVYVARSDGHGRPALIADHMAPIQYDGGLPDFLGWLFGGTGEQDALDWRYYYAALDANLAGDAAPAFDMGHWSDGVPVTAPRRVTAP